MELRILIQQVSVQDSVLDIFSPGGVYVHHRLVYHNTPSYKVKVKFVSWCDRKGYPWERAALSNEVLVVKTALEDI